MGISKANSMPAINASYSVSLFECLVVSVSECMMMPLFGVTKTMPTPEDLSMLSHEVVEGPRDVPSKNISQSFFIYTCMTFLSGSSI